MGLRVVFIHFRAQFISSHTSYPSYFPRASEVESVRWGFVLAAPQAPTCNRTTKAFVCWHNCRVLRWGGITTVCLSSWGAALCSSGSLTLLPGFAGVVTHEVPHWVPGLRSYILQHRTGLLKEVKCQVLWVWCCKTILASLNNPLLLVWLMQVICKPKSCCCPSHLGLFLLKKKSMIAKNFFWQFDSLRPVW